MAVEITARGLAQGATEPPHLSYAPGKIKTVIQDLKKKKSMISISADWEHLLVDLRELCRAVALPFFTAKAIEMPFLSCNRVSGGGEITAASAESYLAALCWGAKGTP